MRRILRVGVPILLVGAIFFYAFPKIADFSKVWVEIRAMTWVEIGTLFLASLWNIFTYWFVMMASLPGSNIWQTMKINQASTAVSNTLPGGGAIGVGVTYSMYTAYGFSKSAISLSLLVSGIWNNFVKLGMPVVALALLVATGKASGGLVVASLVGLAMLLIAIAMFGAVLSSDRMARKVGDQLSRVVSFLRRIVRKDAVDLADATARFRKDAIGLIKHRWVRLTLATVVSHLSLYVVLLLALRHVGVGEAEVSWTEALAGFAFIRLVSALPITPGGLGLVELGLTAALVSAGGARAEVVAAVLVYRALTYLLPIPIGLLMYITWRKGSVERRSRLDAVTSTPSSPGISGP